MLFPIYLATKNNTSRYYIGTKGIKTLVTIGLNPSKATNIKPDSTISRINHFYKLYYYDSFLMFNLYPLRSTSPAALPEVGNLKLHNINKRLILNKISKNNFSDFLFCWGDNISVRPYLKEFLVEIFYEIKPYIKNSYCLGSLTQRGNPRHPGRLSYETKLNKFNIIRYFK